MDTFTVFMTYCKNTALTIGVDLQAVPRGIVKRVKSGNRVDWEIDDVFIENYYHSI